MRFRLAFSIIELSTVIVVIGILASLSIPRIQRDIRQEAIDSIIANIRLTQRMALSDHQHRDGNIWQKSYWKWLYVNCKKGNIYYVVTSNRDYDRSFDRKESAIDPYNQKYLYGSTIGYCGYGKINTKDSSRVLLSEKFGISSIHSYGGCSGNKHIAFDELGRPHSGIDSYKSPNYNFLMKENCSLTFNFKENTIVSNIKPFTLIVEAISGRVYLKK